MLRARAWLPLGPAPSSSLNPMPERKVCSEQPREAGGLPSKASAPWGRGPSTHHGPRSKAPPPEGQATRQPSPRCLGVGA